LEDSNASGANGDQASNNARDSGAAYVFTGLGQTSPKLEIEPSAFTLRINWPLSASDFVLEETGVLEASPLSWFQLLFPYETNATQMSVTLPMPSGNTFYRLRRL